MHLDRYIEVSSSKDLATFEKRLLGMAHDLGFGLVSGALVIENLVEKEKYQYHAFGNTPQEFLDASFQASSSARDPVLKRLKELSIPFCYSQDLYVQEGVADLWEEQAAFGYRAGVAVALHLPGHQHFLLGVDREESLPKNGAELSRLMADVQFLAVHAQSAALAILGPKETHETPKFSARELEVLKWARIGKSAWETGQILGLSEQGVHYHMRSIFLKLDVSSKQQAVLRAMNLGII